MLVSRPPRATGVRREGLAKHGGLWYLVGMDVLLRDRLSLRWRHGSPCQQEIRKWTYSAPTPSSLFKKKTCTSRTETRRSASALRGSAHDERPGDAAFGALRSKNSNPTQQRSEIDFGKVNWTAKSIQGRVATFEVKVGKAFPSSAGLAGVIEARDAPLFDLSICIDAHLSRATPPRLTLLSGHGGGSETGLALCGESE